MVAALAAAAPAQAGELMGKVRNNAGGFITFYTRQATMCGEHFLVITKAKNGSATTGCWNFIGRDVVVVWSDGGVSSFEFDDITFDPDFLNTLRSGS
jgi:hypothetical protein